MFLKFVLHIAYSNYIFLLSQIKILHIECLYYICLSVWLPPFLPAGTSLSCGCFFAEASKPFRDPRLGFLFAEEFPFPSPGPSSQFFLRPGNTSFALVLFSGKMSVLSLQSFCQNFWFMRGGWIRGFLIHSAKKIYFHTSGWLFEELC